MWQKDSCETTAVAGAHRGIESRTPPVNARPDTPPFSTDDTPRTSATGVPTPDRISIRIGIGIGAGIGH